jgi:hypothetical protein
MEPQASFDDCPVIVYDDNLRVAKHGHCLSDFEPNNLDVTFEV